MSTYEIWANELIRSGQVKNGIGKDGFDSSDSAKLHYLHEVIFLNSQSNNNWDTQEIINRTLDLQSAIGFSKAELSKPSALKSHLNSMRKCISISSKFKSEHRHEDKSWLGMFGDRTDGHRLIVKVDSFCLRPDLLSKYKKQKIARGELVVTSGSFGDVESHPLPIEEYTDDYSPDNTDQRVFDLVTIALRRGKTQFRNQIMERFQSTCVITLSTCTPVLEAAHICPFLGEKDDNSANGLLLRSDVHTLFDLNLLRINAESHKVEIDESLHLTEYWQYHNKQLNFTAKSRPSTYALNWRYKHYKTTGQGV